MKRFAPLAALMLGSFMGAESPHAQAAPEPSKTSVTANGLVADFFVPADAQGRLPAIIILGGSEGGLGSATARAGRMLAVHGYATLQLAYFDAPGLPKELSLIPLEYFKTAIDWLHGQAGVDANRIGIVGGSIGGEVALMAASHYHEIKVVVAAMPSSVVWPGIVHTEGEPTSTFTLAGKPLPFLPYGHPFTSVFNLYAKGLLALDQHGDAIIPVDRINGPVMLVCGKSDSLWPSCPMSEQMDARLKFKHFSHSVQLLEYPDAGHAVFGQPVSSDDPHIAELAKLGGSVEGNQKARRDSWTRAMAFLDAALKR